MSRVLAWAVAAVLAWTAWAALGPGTADTQQPSSGCSQTPQRSRFFARLVVDGARRSALVNVPQGGRADTPLPLVLTFHGAGGTARSTESTTGMSELGNRNAFISVYPNAIGRYWDVAGRGANPDDDVIFIGSLLDQLDAALCIDDSRVYATGVSNGGSFVARIGCELSNRLAAIAPVAGGYGAQPPCQPDRPVSLLEIHGTDDRTVPYDGDGPHGEGGVWSFLAQWNGWDGCPGDAPVWRRLAARAFWVAKTPCAAGTTVAHIKLVDEPHAWPTTKWTERRPHVGVLFSARQAVWDFFETRTVPAALPVHKRRRHS
jgi:polyhydroxybutyrate depolymerase